MFINPVAWHQQQVNYNMPLICVLDGKINFLKEHAWVSCSTCLNQNTTYLSLIPMLIFEQESI